MSNIESRPDDIATEEQLVAYLDGELDADTARRLEELLATDEQVRTRLQRLERVWDALDSLPRAELDESFVHTTVEMVAVNAAEELRSQEMAAPRRNRVMALVGSVLCAAALVAGYSLASVLWPNPNDALLEDLPILERFDEYRQVDTIEFVRQLHERRLFPEEGDDEN